MKKLLSVLLVAGLLASCGGGGGGGSGSGSGSGSGGSGGGGSTTTACTLQSLKGTYINITQVEVLDANTNQPLQKNAQGYYPVALDQPVRIRVYFQSNASCAVVDGYIYYPVHDIRGSDIGGFYSSSPAETICKLYRDNDNTLKFACLGDIQDVAEPVGVVINLTVQDIGGTYQEYTASTQPIIFDLQ